jgi:DNA-binding NarL/FixJ family response regulator
MKTRVMVVDDHASIRQMLGALLPREGAFEMVAEAGTGLEAIQMHRKARPHLVVLDLVLPEMNGIGLLQYLREQSRETRTIVYCGTDRRDLILEALRARPHGFVLKRDPFAAFREALRMVTSGCSYFTSFATRLLDEERSATGNPFLSPRERAVVQMVAEGRSNKEVAKQLEIAAKTVERHRARVMEKLGVHDVAGLTRYAMRNGLVSVE